MCIRDSIKPFIKSIGSNFVLIVIFDVFKSRFSVYFFIAVDEYVSVFILSIFVQREECDVFSFICFIDREDSTFNYFIVV